MLKLMRFNPLNTKEVVAQGIFMQYAVPLRLPSPDNTLKLDSKAWCTTYNSCTICRSRTSGDVSGFIVHLRDLKFSQ